MFRVGQKVVFIGPDFRGHPQILRRRIVVPVPQQIYSIRAFAPRRPHDGYLLNEIINPEYLCPLNGLCEIAIDADWLRPLVERKTDISVFTKMLTPKEQKVDA